jgi:hypothetical protein
MVVSVRSARPSLWYLLDRGVFVVHVQARGDAFGDHPGAEPAGCLTGPGFHQSAIEDQADLVRATDVEVVADDLFEEHSTVDRGVEHLREGELGLQDGELIPVLGVPVLLGERVRQDGQPLIQ